MKPISHSYFHPKLLEEKDPNLAHQRWVSFASIYCLFGLSNATFKLIGTNDDNSVALWFLLYSLSVILLCGFLILSRLKRVLEFLFDNKALVCLIAYMVVSCVWALDKTGSFVTVVRYSISALFGFYLAAQFSERKLLPIIAITMSGIVVSSFIFGIFFPSWGRIIDGGPNSGSWQGAFTSRNGLAIFMNISYGVFAICAWRYKKYRFLNILFAFLSAMLVILSRSATGFFMLMLISSLPILMPIARKQFMLLVAIGFACISLLALLLVLSSSMPSVEGWFTAIGKSPTLSGRTNTWKGGMEILKENKLRALLGYGAQDTNLTKNGQIITEGDARKMGISDPGDSEGALPMDNTYANVLMKFGLLGSALFAVCLYRAVVNNKAEVIRKNTIMYGFYTIVLLILFINGVTESVERQTLLWVFFAMMLVSPHIPKEDNNA